jgi:hypothetical protein
MKGGEGKMIRELVFLQVRKGDGVERAEEGWTRVNGLVINSIPYLKTVSVTSSTIPISDLQSFQQYAL